MQTLLSVQSLRTYFSIDHDLIKAVDGASFSIRPGETVCLIGESGSGKTASALSILGLVEGSPGVVGGQIWFDGCNLLEDLERYCDISMMDHTVAIRKDVTAWRKIYKRKAQAIRGKKISMIFQDPVAALNPTMTIGAQVKEAILSSGFEGSRGELREKAIEWLHRVRIPSPTEYIQDYPYQLSGGLCQRVMIAIALASNPILLIADEPTTALDATVQRQILSLLKSIQEEMGLAMLVITHDLMVSAHIADSIAVMYAGRVVEQGPREEVLYSALRHPYTQGLLDALPRQRIDGYPCEFIEGTSPDPADLPDGCKFHPRCKLKVDVENNGAKCSTEEPEISIVGPRHTVRCWRSLSDSQSTIS